MWKSIGKVWDVMGLRRDRGERGIRYSRQEAQKYRELVT